VGCSRGKQARGKKGGGKTKKACTGEREKEIGRQRRQEGGHTERVDKKKLSDGLQK